MANIHGIKVPDGDYDRLLDEVTDDVDQALEVFLRTSSPTKTTLRTEPVEGGTSWERFGGIQ